MKRFIAVVIAAIMVPQMSFAISIEKEAFLFDKAKQGMMETFKDPDSAKFSDMVANEKFMAVCGRVNAKNGFGGYVGKQRFISNGVINALEGRDMEPSEFQQSWDQICM